MRTAKCFFGMGRLRGEAHVVVVGMVIEKGCGPSACKGRGVTAVAEPKTDRIRNLTHKHTHTQYNSNNNDDNSSRYSGRRNRGETLKRRYRTMSCRLM